MTQKEKKLRGEMLEPLLISFLFRIYKKGDCGLEGK